MKLFFCLTGRLAQAKIVHQKRFYFVHNMLESFGTKRILPGRLFIISFLVMLLVWVVHVRGCISLRCGDLLCDVGDAQLEQSKMGHWTRFYVVQDVGCTASSSWYLSGQRDYCPAQEVTSISIFPCLVWVVHVRGCLSLRCGVLLCDIGDARGHHTPARRGQRSVGRRRGNVLLHGTVS